MKFRILPMSLLFCLASAPVHALTLVGHLGGYVAEESIENLEDMNWNGSIADLAIEGSLFGPLSLGVGAEFRLNDEELAKSSREAGFAYAKLRAPLPLSPYLGLGFEARKNSDDDWKIGQLAVAGLGFKISRLSLDLELRVTRLELDDVVFRSFSVRPGLSLWL